jgi:type IV secretory pathway TrbD component
MLDYVRNIPAPGYRYRARPTQSWLRHEGKTMGARRKLNQAYFNGSLIIAGVLGLITQSWVIFSLVLISVLGLNVASRNIR